VSSKSTTKYPFPINSSIDRKRMLDLVKDNFMLNRSAVNPDTDILTRRLAEALQGRVLESQSGSMCLKWTIPDNWNVRKGQLKTKSGKIIADFDDHPMYLWTHSVSFSGVISKQELIEKHILTNPRRPDEFLYHYMHGYQEGKKEWGFSLPYNTVKSLNEDEYVVEIDTDLDNDNTLKLVDAHIPGKNEDTIFIMAHTCHPGQVGDGMACIAVANELFFWLKEKNNLKYSYRFIYGPEYWGGATWLEHAPTKDVSNMKYGVFLDMVSTHEPLGYQESMQGNSLFDKVFLNVFESHKEVFIHKEFRGLWGNDETFYNGAGFKIPTLGMGRGMHREYHYNTDNLENMSLYNMEETVWILMRIIEVMESDYIPVLSYLGPLYLSRYGLFINKHEDYDGYINSEKIQALADGKLSCFDIAHKLKLDFYFVRNFFDSMLEKDLITRIERNPQESDSGFL